MTVPKSERFSLGCFGGAITGLPRGFPASPLQLVAVGVYSVLLFACQQNIDGLYVSCLFPDSHYYTHSITLEDGEFIDSEFRDLGGLSQHAGTFHVIRGEVRFNVSTFRGKELPSAPDVPPFVYSRELRFIDGQPALGPIISISSVDGLELEPIDHLEEVFIRGKHGEVPKCPPEARPMEDSG